MNSRKFIKLILTFLLLFFSIENSIAQLYTKSSKAIIADSGIVLTKGFYKNYNEFKRNSPSIHLDAELIHSENINDPINTFVINIKNEPKSTQGLIVWGYCDGTSVYVNRGGYHTKLMRYDKIQILDQYCYYESSSFFEAPVEKSRLIPVYSEKSMYFNIENGNKTELTKKEMRSILAPYPELLDHFKNEADPKGILKRYFKLFLQAYHEKK